MYLPFEKVSFSSEIFLISVISLLVYAVLVVWCLI